MPFNGSYAFLKIYFMLHGVHLLMIMVKKFRENLRKNSRKQWKAFVSRAFHCKLMNSMNLSNNGNIDTITRFLLVNAKWVHFGESVRHPFWIILFHNTYISKFTRELYLLNIPPLCYQFVLHTFIY